MGRPDPHPGGRPGLPAVGCRGVPILGPLLVKAITLPLVFIINGLAFLASLLGIKKGHGRKVLESRLVAGLLTLGILIGYILGKLF